MAVELTSIQIEALEADLANKQASVEALKVTQESYPAQVQNQKEIDDAYKAVFDAYDSIVVAYEDERKALDGFYIDEPIIEQDIIDAGSLAGGRIMPTQPVTDVIRIQEFDHAPLIDDTTDEDNETYHIAQQLIAEDRLQNGFGGSFPVDLSTDIITTSVVTSSSTSVGLELVDLSPEPEATFVVGNIFVLADGSNSIVVEVTGGSSLAASPYNLDIKVLSSSGSAGVGSWVGGFSGFNNTERTNKVTNSVNLYGNNVSYQNVMDALINDLEAIMNNRLVMLGNQITAIDSNQDGDLDNTAKTKAQTSQTFINDYLISTDISDTGITTLVTERGVRTPEVATRITDIVDAFTMGTINYLDSRYTAANDRANTARGSMRILKFLEGVNNNFGTDIADLEEAIASLEALLNCV